MIEEKFKIVAEFAESGIEAIKRTGLRVAALKERYARVVMPLQGNVSHLGTMYAGSLFILGEFSGGIIFGAAFDYTKFVPVVKEISIRFVRAAKSDVVMEVAMNAEQADAIQREAEQNGKADFHLNIELKDAAGETVSVVEGTWQVRQIQGTIANKT